MTLPEIYVKCIIFIYNLHIYYLKGALDDCDDCSERPVDNCSSCGNDFMY